MKRSHAYKGYASTYYVETLNSYNPEIQFKDTESAVRSKLKDLLTELKGFKLWSTFVLEFKKVENDNERRYSSFNLYSKAETNINEEDLDNAF